MEASRIIQVVPGQRVRVSMRSALATGAILVVVGTAAMGRSSSGPTDERLATVRARPDPVQSYQPSSTDSAIRGVANKIWESDHYRSEMMQSFFLWLVCAPLLVLAIFACRKYGPCRSAAEDYMDLDDAKHPFRRDLPLAQATYGATATVVPAELISEARGDDTLDVVASAVERGSSESGDESGGDEGPEEYSL